MPMVGLIHDQCPVEEFGSARAVTEWPAYAALSAKESWICATTIVIHATWLSPNRARLAPVSSVVSGFQQHFAAATTSTEIGETTP
jgi:hypothetical protein